MLDKENWNFQLQKHLAFFGVIIRNLNSSFLKCFVCKTFKKLFCCGFNFDYNFSFTEIVCFCWVCVSFQIVAVTANLGLKWICFRRLLKSGLLLSSYFKILRHVKIILKRIKLLKMYILIKLHSQRHSILLIKKIFIYYINNRIYFNLIHLSTIKFWLITVFKNNFD